MVVDVERGQRPFQQLGSARVQRDHLGDRRPSRCGCLRGSTVASVITGMTTVSAMMSMPNSAQSSSSSRGCASRWAFSALRTRSRPGLGWYRHHELQRRLRRRRELHHGHRRHPEPKPSPGTMPDSSLRTPSPRSVAPRRAPTTRSSGLDCVVARLSGLAPLRSRGRDVGIATDRTVSSGRLEQFRPSAAVPGGSLSPK